MQVSQGSVHNAVVGMSRIGECEKGHRGEVGMRIQFDTKDHGIAGIPSALGTRPVDEHIERAGNAW